MRRHALAVALAVWGCSKSTADEPAVSADDAGSRGSVVDRQDGGRAPKLPECAEETKDVFVISAENALYSFSPPTLTFKHLGLLRCPTGGATPTSMAVDRSGIAWVRHTDASIWKVSTKDLSCEPTRFAPPGGNGAFFKFGMGFSTATKGGSTEELFLSDHDGAGLAKLDTRTLGVSFIGPYTGDLAGATSELTGTGEGKLYGFFVTAPARIAEISKGTGEIVSSKELPGVSAGNAWAFSFYGGDFFIYTSSAGGGGPPLAGGGSDVTRYRPATDALEVVKAKIGFTIVGAGVSTCAPTTSIR